MWGSTTNVKIGLLLLGFGVPIILNFFIPKFHFGITNNETWLLFWATWLGTIFAGIITLTGINITLNDSRQQYEEIRQRDEENRRLSLQPFLNVYNAEEDELPIKKTYSYDFRDLENKNDTYNLVRFNLIIENIGMGLASNLYVMSLKIIEGSETNPIEDLKYLAIQKDSSINIQLNTFFNECLEISTKNFILTIHFRDILENRYKQKIKIFCQHNGSGEANNEINITDISNPELLDTK